MKFVLKAAVAFAHQQCISTKMASAHLAIRGAVHKILFFIDSANCFTYIIVARLVCAKHQGELQAVKKNTMYWIK